MNHETSITEQLEELRPHPIDKEYTETYNGGCWICRRGNGWEETDKFEFDVEENIFYHPQCVEKLGFDDKDKFIEFVSEQENNNGD